MRIDGEQIWLDEPQDAWLPIAAEADQPLPLVSFEYFMEGWLEVAFANYRRAWGAPVPDSLECNYAAAELAILLEAETLIGLTRYQQANQGVLATEAEAWLESQG